MRIIFPISLCSIVVQSAAPQDPCWLVCDEYSAARNGMGFDLCGASESHCDLTRNTCTFLYWSRTEDGQEGMINSEIEQDLTGEELANPLSCTRAREMVAHRLAETSQPRRVVAVENQVVAHGPPAVPAYYPGVRGLRNIGASCYVNTALQILTHMRPARELLDNLYAFAEAGVLEVDADMPYQQHANVQYLRSLVDLYTGMTNYAAGAGSQSPAAIMQNLAALGFNQFGHIGVAGDMPEALANILEATSGALESFQGAPAAGQLDALRQIFSVDVQTRNDCLECGAAIGAPQIENALNVDIVLDLHMDALSLVDGLHMTFGPGIAEGLACPHGHMAVIPTKQLANTRDIFVAQIHRVDEATGQRINTPITFPSGDADLLDLTPFIAPGSPSLANPRYRLVAISHHNGGHYFADINHEGTWYRVDDEIVYPLAGAPAGPSTTASMLFYERVPAAAPVVVAPAVAAAGEDLELDFTELLQAFQTSGQR